MYVLPVLELGFYTNATSDVYPKRVAVGVAQYISLVAGNVTRLSTGAQTEKDNFTFLGRVYHKAEITPKHLLLILNLQPFSVACRICLNVFWM